MLRRIVFGLVVGTLSELRSFDDLQPPELRGEQCERQEDGGAEQMGSQPRGARARLIGVVHVACQEPIVTSVYSRRGVRSQQSEGQACPSRSWTSSCPGRERHPRTTVSWNEAGAIFGDCPLLVS